MTMRMLQAVARPLHGWRSRWLRLPRLRLTPALCLRAAKQAERVSRERGWAEERKLRCARSPLRRQRSLKRAGWRLASKEYGPVRRCSYYLLHPSYLSRPPHLLRTSRPRRSFLLLPTSSFRTSSISVLTSCFLETRYGQQSRQLAAQDFAAAKQARLECALRQAQAAGRARHIHFVKIK